MGCFSFMYAYVDEHTKFLNLHAGDVARMLIPEEYVHALPEFGRGYIEGTYDGYGNLCVEGYTYPIKYDMYTILALINNEFLLGECESLPTCDDAVNEELRLKGIMECESYAIPLKVVPSHIDITYEEVLNVSEDDESQGWESIFNPDYIGAKYS